MVDMEGIVSQSREAARLEEQVLAQQARQLQTAAGYMVEALRTGKGLHLLGDGPLAHLAAYLASVLHRPSSLRTLPARVLCDPSGGQEGPARAVEAFVRFGEVLLILAERSAPAVERAAALARGSKARVVCLCGDEAAREFGEICDVTITISATGSALAEVALSIGLRLQSMVLLGLGTRQQTRSPTRSIHSSSFSDLGVIDRDARAADSDLSTEGDGSLLAQAVELGLNPPTDPRGRPLRAVSPPEPPLPPGPRNLRFRCGACMEIINIEARHAGRRGQCPHCYCEFRIPQASDPESSEAIPIPIPIPKEAITQAPPTNPLGAPTRSRTTRRRTRRTERRRSTRFVVRDAQVRWQGDSYPDGATYLEPFSLEDLSLTGLRFVGRTRDFKIGDVCFFAVDFPAFPMPVRFKGEIRRLIPLKEDDRCSAGVRFLEYVGDAEARIRRLLEHDNLREVRRR